MSAFQYEGMAKQHAKGRNRLHQQPAQNVFVRKDPGSFLAEPKEFRTQFVFHKGAMKGPVDLQRRHYIGAVEYAVMLLDVVKLDREAIRCSPDFRLGQKK